MPNFFDQFDQPKAPANFFDQFDAPSRNMVPGPKGPVPGKSNRPEDQEFDLGTMTRSFLGGGNKLLGSAMFVVPTLADEALAATIPGYEGGTPAGWYQSYMDTFAPKQPDSRANRVAETAGEAAMGGLLTGGILGEAAKATAPLVRSTTGAVIEGGSDVVSRVKDILDQTMNAYRAAPMAAVTGDITSGAASGAAIQAVSESDSPWLAPFAGVVGGAIPNNTPYSVASRGVKRVFDKPVEFIKNKAAETLLPDTPAAAKYRSDTKQWRNREGDYADPNVPEPEQPKGIFEGLRADAFKRRAENAQATVQKSSDAVLANNPENIAAANALREKIPGYRPTLAESSGDQNLLNLQKEIEANMSGDELRTRLAQRDEQANTINAFAEKSAPEVQLPESVTDPESFLQSSVSRRVAEALAPINSDIDATNTSIREATNALPSVNTLDAGENLRGMRDAKQAEMNATVKAQRAAIDPDKTFRQDGERLSGDLSRTLASLGTDLSDPVIPNSVRQITRKLAPDESTILGPDGAPLVSNPSFDVDSILKAREDVGKNLRDLSQSTDLASAKAKSTLVAARDALDREISLISDSGVEGVSDRLKAANKFYREEYVPRFGQDMGQDLGRTRNNGAEVIKGEDIATRMFGPNNVTEARQFNLIHGEDPAARQAMTDLALDDIRRSGVKDGMLDKNAVSSWITKHSRILDEMPWLKESIAGKDPQALYSKLGELEARRQSVADSEINRMLGDGADPSNTIDLALKDRVRMQTLKKGVADDPNLDGALKRAVWNRAIGSGATDEPLLSSGKMAAFMKDNEPSLRVALGDKHYADLETVVKAAEITGRSARPTGKSAELKTDVDVLGSVFGTSLASATSQARSVMEGRVGPVPVAVNVATRAANSLSRSQTREAWKAAFYDPNVAELLASSAKSGKMTPMQSERIKAYLLALPAVSPEPVPEDQKNVR
jgi:hypothetical protein